MYVKACFGKLASQYKYKAKDASHYLYIDDIYGFINQNESNSKAPLIEKLQVITDIIIYLKFTVLNDGQKRHGDSFKLEQIQWVFALPIDTTYLLKGLVRTACLNVQMITTMGSGQLIFCPVPEAELICYQRFSPTEISNGFLAVHINVGTRYTTICCNQIFTNLKLKNLLNTSCNLGTDRINNNLIESFKARYKSNYDQWEQNIPEFTNTLAQKIQRLKEGTIGITDTYIKVLIDESPQSVVCFTADESNNAIKCYEINLQKLIESQLEQIVSLNPNEAFKVFLQGETRFINLVTSILPTNFQPLVLGQDSVLSGLTALGLDQHLIQKRLYRYSYGTQFSKLFDPVRDDHDQYKWGMAPNQYIAAYLPFTTAGKPIPADQIFEQLG